MNPEITRPESVKNANLPIGPDASSGPVRAIHGELRSVLRLESKFDPSRTRAFLSIAINLMTNQEITILKDFYLRMLKIIFMSPFQIKILKNTIIL